MDIKDHIYIAIDLKSFYASVECIERGLDPITTNLVVADESRTEKTICLAVTPSLKKLGISGRSRLFEVVQKVKMENNIRKNRVKNHILSGSSFDETELGINPELAIDYIAAPPRMGKYMEYSKRIYTIYLKYVAPEDIHVYSVDEVFMDVTSYLKNADLTPREFATRILKDVYKEVGITATAGIGTNIYLSKIAMDIVAKKIPPDENDVRIAELDEISYRKTLWDHRPITDFWRVGRGYGKKLAENGIYTMGDVARCSLGKNNEFYNEDLLYKLFGINAELLIDHAWGWEPCTIADIKSYKPSTKSLGSGQVLQYPYSFDKARVIVSEMTDLLVLDMVDKGFVTDQIVLTVGYDIENLIDQNIKNKYKGEVKTDHYGRKIPKDAHGTINLKSHTSSTKDILKAVDELYIKIVNHDLYIRRITISANHILLENEIITNTYEQLDLFTDHKKFEKEKTREKNIQKAVIDIKKKYGKNAILKGTNFKEGAMTIERNNQIGGHKA